MDQQGGQGIEGGSRDKVPAALLEEAHDNVKEVESEDGKDGGCQDPVVPGGVGLLGGGDQEERQWTAGWYSVQCGQEHVRDPAHG